MYLRIALILITAGFLSGCKKFVSQDAPYTSVNSANVYQTDASAASVLTGIYAKLSTTASVSAGIQSVSYFAGLSADEFTLWSGIIDPIQINCYKNSQSSQSTVDMWSSIYQYVFDCNAAIQGINASTTLTPAVKSQLLGEAKFMRAFFYFYLVNFYGDAPLILSTQYTETAIVPRTPAAQLYQQIVQDLKDATGLLSPSYLDASIIKATTERTRPTKWAANALLARTYLYTNDYSDAEAQAGLVIADSPQYKLSSLAGVFLKNSSEAIWQLQPVVAGYNTWDAREFIIPSTGLSTGVPVYLSNRLLNAFDSADQRKSNWINNVTLSGTKYYYPFKYKVNVLNNLITNSNSGMTEYTMVLRLAEQYLIRAEARAQQGNISGTSGAIADLNVIRMRAGLPVYAGAPDKDSVLAAIMHERRVELFTEWGHRWFDLKRTSSADSVMGGVSGACQAKGGNWVSTDILFPIIAAQLQANPDLVQNPGYQ